MPRPGTEANGVIQTFSGDIHAIVVGRQPQIYERMFRPELRQPRQQPTHGERTDRANGQHFAVLSASEAFKNLRDVIERRAQYRQQGFPSLVSISPRGRRLNRVTLSCTSRLLT